MAREPHGDERPTLMRRAANYTDHLTSWRKVAANAVWVLGVLGAVVFWGGQALRAVKGFGPLEVQFRSHVGEYTDHVEEAGATVRELDSDLHTILEQNDVVQRQLGTVLERLDTLSTEQRWAQCIRERDRDIDAGRPARECRPFGGGP